MSTLLRVLMVADSEDETALLVRELQSSGFDLRYTCVETAEAMAAALDVQLWDLVISDYSLPQFSGLTALQMVQESGLDIPFLLVSGVVGEETAVVAMRAGASDYLVKGNLARLAPAVECQLREAEVRRQSRQAQYEEHEALKQSVRNLERMVSNVPGMMFRVLTFPDGSVQYTYVSEACCELFGVFPEQFLSYGLTVRDMVHPDDCESFDRASAPIGATPQPWQWRGRCLLPTGEIKVIQALIRPDREENGGLVWDGLLYEVTLQVEAEREAAQLAHIVNSSGEAIISETLGGTITSWNSAAERMYGYTAAEMIGQSIERLMPPDRPDEISNLIERIAHGEFIPSYDTVRLARDGGLLDVSVTLSPLRDSLDRITGVATIEHDITERKRLENQLLQAQKMESVGRLAGGVAHDFNNLLTVILGNVEMAEEEGPLEPSHKAYLHNITHAVERAADLTRQLLAFARRQVIKPRSVNLNDLTLSLDKILRRLITESIELVILPAENLHTVMVDPSQFEQILINLVVNARDAMNHGGKITIETANTTLDEDYARHHEGVTPGQYVVLMVSDTGSGMDEAVRLHIFEPFFTTKAVGRGTGLGLATVYGIVKQAGGHIWLYSEADAGTTFKIYLPRTAEQPASLVTASPDVAAQGGSETILLVEDEPNVRTLAVQALQRQGYTVLHAMNGEEALRLVKGQEHKITLLITDVVMPQMSGKELADRLQAIHPTLKILYASGYTENTIVHHGVLEAGIIFLSKPFTPTVLMRKVREVLDQLEPASTPRKGSYGTRS